MTVFDRAAVVLVLMLSTLCVASGMPATVFFGRQYWSLTFGVAVACFAPAGVAVVRASGVTRWRPRALH